MIFNKTIKLTLVLTTMVKSKPLIKVVDTKEIVSFREPNIRNL